MNDKKREKMIGERFGKLEVLSFEGVRNEKAIFKCRCDCGKEVVVRGNDLKAEVQLPVVAQRKKQSIKGMKKPGTYLSVQK